MSLLLGLISFELSPNLFQGISEGISRELGEYLPRVGATSNYFIVMVSLFCLKKRLSLMKYMATFVLCLFRALCQGNDKMSDFPNNLYGEKIKAVRVPQ